MTKKANLLKFIGVMGVEKNLSYFLRLPSAFVDLVAPWVFTYRGYSTNLLHRPQITTVSDYVMSFLETGGWRERNFSLFVMIKTCVFC